MPRPTQRPRAAANAAKTEPRRDRSPTHGAVLPMSDCVPFPRGPMSAHASAYVPSPTLAEGFALAERGAVPLDAEALAEALTEAHAQRASIDHARARIAAFRAAVGRRTPRTATPRAKPMVQPGDRVRLGFAHVLQAAAALRTIDGAMDAALSERTEPLVERILELLDRWDAEGRSLVFQRERKALQREAAALALPATVEGTLSTAEDAMFLRRFGIDEHEDAAERIELARALATDARLLALEVVAHRARAHPDALRSLAEWAATEGLLDVPPSVLLASTRQVSLHLAAVREDLSLFAAEAGEPARGLGLVRWAVRAGHLDEAAEIVLLRAPLHTR